VNGIQLLLSSSTDLDALIDCPGCFLAVCMGSSGISEKETSWQRSELYR
jgi:hypothetical protein